MISRDYSYDYLRAFSAIMIVFCHIFQGFGINVELGYFLGGTFVDVFLLLSAYLLGMSSRDSILHDPIKFLRKRVCRIVPVYYVYLSGTFLVIFFMIGWDSLSFTQIFGHYLFINWFWEPSRIFAAPLPQLGHLWFMSCILFGYVYVLVLGSLLNKLKLIDSTRCWQFYFVITALVSTYASLKVRFMIYPFTVILAFSILYFRGKEIMCRLNRLSHRVLVAFLVCGNAGGVIYYQLSGYDFNPIVFWINLINAFLWIACAPVIFNRSKINRAVMFMASISFEIYLIHHPFCLGSYSLKQYMSTPLAAICVFIISITFGWLLSIITKVITARLHIN